MRKLALRLWVMWTVRNRWDKENSDFLAREGFARDILKHPEKIPATQPGDCPGSAISYDKDFPSKVIPEILSVASSKEEARRYIERVFGKIQRGTEMVADGNHHSPDYGKPIYPSRYINTEEALALAKYPIKLRESVYGKVQITSTCSPDVPFIDEHGIERIVE